MMERKHSESFAWNARIFIVLISIALLNWVVFRSFTVRIYYTAIPALLAVQIMLNDLLEYILVSRAGTTLWFSLLAAPGTIVHEISHAATAIVTGCRLTSLSLFSLNRSTGVLGSVTYVAPRDNFTFLRSVLVTVAPFFGCGVAVLLIARNVFHQIIALNGGLATLGGLSAGIMGSMSLLADEYSQIGFESPLMALALYIQLCLAFGAAPSGFDFKGLLSSAKGNLSSLLLAIVLVVAGAYSVDWLIPIEGYETSISGFVLLLLDRTVLLLCLSTALLAFSTASVISMSLWLSAGFVIKIASIALALITYPLTELMGCSGGISLLIAWAAFLTTLLIVNDPEKKQKTTSR
ncbi:MAG: hypothetical protein PHG85_07335 [Candidatus Altiarchaeota archaeon]|nr:hypothetical protein [Candidatus Altiarchaeota archaeon]